MAAMSKSVPWLCVAFMLVARAGPSAPVSTSGPPESVGAKQATAANVDARQSIIAACSKLTDARSSPFPFPTGRVSMVCECAAGRLEGNGRMQQIAQALSEDKPPSADSERNYFVSKVAAAALSCLGDDLGKIAEDERQLSQPEVTSWLNTLSASVPVVWPADTGSIHVPKILVPNQEEAARGKKGCRKPQYPDIAGRKEVTGTVTMAFLVDSDGRVSGARVVRSSGETPSHKLLDATALADIGDCEFRPGTVDGVPVQSWAKIQYEWRIK